MLKEYLNKFIKEMQNLIDGQNDDELSLLDELIHNEILKRHKKLLKQAI